METNQKIKNNLSKAYILYGFYAVIYIIKENVSKWFVGLRVFFKLYTWEIFQMFRDVRTNIFVFTLMLLGIIFKDLDFVPKEKYVLIVVFWQVVGTMVTALNETFWNYKVVNERDFGDGTWWNIFK